MVQQWSFSNYLVWLKQASLIIWHSIHTFSFMFYRKWMKQKSSCFVLKKLMNHKNKCFEPNKIWIIIPHHLTAFPFEVPIHHAHYVDLHHFRLTLHLPFQSKFRSIFCVCSFTSASVLCLFFITSTLVLMLFLLNAVSLIDYELLASIKINCIKFMSVDDCEVGVFLDDLCVQIHMPVKLFLQTL